MEVSRKMTAPSNITGLATFSSWVNSASEGWLGTLIVIALFVISFLSLKKYSTGRAIMASTFFTGVLSIFFYLIGMVSSNVVFLFVVGAGLSVCYIAFFE